MADANPPAPEVTEEMIREFANELRKWWSFSAEQRHTHSWHSREDFIEKKLPALLASFSSKAAEDMRERCAEVAEEWAASEMKGIILGSEIEDALPHDGDPVAPMISDNSAAAKLANELARVKAHLIADGIRSIPITPEKAG